jgi:hypothetical protein
VCDGGRQRIGFMKSATGWPGAAAKPSDRSTKVAKNWRAAHSARPANSQAVDAVGVALGLSIRRLIGGG